VCEVHADPPPRSFKWKFNSSGESYDIAKDRFSKNGSQSSVLHYQPVMDQDYGTLTCSGQNEVGEQTTPCVFQVILAGEHICYDFTISPWVRLVSGQIILLVRHARAQPGPPPKSIISRSHEKLSENPKPKPAQHFIYFDALHSPPIARPELLDQQSDSAFAGDSVSARLRWWPTTNVSARIDCIEERQIEVKSSSNEMRRSGGNNFIDFCLARLNLTSVEEPLFVLDSLDSLTALDAFGDDSLRAVVFAVNQKGRSHGTLVKEFVFDVSDDSRTGNKEMLLHFL
jgi:hypothetical protein